MRLSSIIALSAALFGLGGCYFQSETQLIPADKAVDPFGSADYYLVENIDDDDRGLLARMPDNSFHEYEDPDKEIEAIYRFMPFSDDSYMNDADKYLTTLCDTGPEDGCYILLLTSKDGRFIKVVMPEPPEDEPEDAPDHLLFDTAEAAIAALGEAVKAGDFSTHDYGIIQSMTQDAADAWLAARQSED